MLRMRVDATAYYYLYYYVAHSKFLVPLPPVAKVTMRLVSLEQATMIREQLS